MNRIAVHTVRAPSFVARLTELLAAIDSTIEWYGRHRPWPANEPVRLDCPRRD